MKSFETAIVLTLTRRDWMQVCQTRQAIKNEVVLWSQQTQWGGKPNTKLKMVVFLHTSPSLQPNIGSSKSIKGHW